MIEFRALGTLVLRGPDGEDLRSVLAQPKRVALLSYLAIARPRGFQQRDTLLALLWPEQDEKHARSAGISKNWSTPSGAHPVPVPMSLHVLIPPRCKADLRYGPIEAQNEEVSSPQWVISTEPSLIYRVSAGFEALLHDPASRAGHAGSPQPCW